MSFFELVDPAGPHYPMEAKSFAVACAAALVLGEGRLGIRSEDESDGMVPGQMNPETWFRVRFRGDLGAFIAADASAVAEALDSVFMNDRFEAAPRPGKLGVGLGRKAGQLAEALRHRGGLEALD